ncbi:MAG: hypothetical protein JWM39_421 [Parcubacteria group bacterium]|nr:hypothetical protein [Parcubacteria group bacterium]
MDNRNYICMGFENLFKKKGVREGAMIAGAAAGIIGAAEIVHSADEMAHGLQHPPTPTVSTMPAEYVNPTAGMTSADAPHAINVPSSEGQTISLGREGDKTISLGESKSVAIDTPER